MKLHSLFKMYVCLCVCAHAYVGMHMCVCTCVSVRGHTHVCMWVMTESERGCEIPWSWRYRK